jgi:predicted TIM-barrel fold metal-dependent hydrolase
MDGMDVQPIIDVDVHHSWPSDAALSEYLSPEWRGYFGFAGGSASAGYSRYGRFQPANLRYPVITGTSMRPETTPPAGGLAGSHYETMRDQHLDPHRISRVILTWLVGQHAGLHNVAASVAVCRAANDYMIDHWLNGRDDRLFGTLCVPLGAQDEAIKEVRRLGAHPRVAAVLLVANPFGKPLGHPVYRPILKAAVDCGLPVITHVGTDTINKATWAAGGLPTTRAESYTALEQPGMHHLSSLLVEGVFEALPDLRVLINECGFTWMPWVLWGLDARYPLLRRENPALRKPPSEYFREHVWASVQPFVIEADAAQVIELLDAYGGLEHQLCYASDYPHWDAEWPTQVAPRLPRAWRPKVFAENAARLFGWSLRDLSAINRPQSRPRRADVQP